MKRLLALLFLSFSLLASLGLASGADAFVSTGDGGWFWQNPLPRGGETLQAVSFVNASRGWAVSGSRTFYSGYRGHILRTDDGGASWQGQRFTGRALYDVTFVTASEGWVVGDTGAIWHTSDGGATWGEQTSGTDMTLTAVDFVDAENGWAVGGPAFAPFDGQTGRVILRTKDGGLTWQTLFSMYAEDAYSLEDVDFVDTVHGWAVGGDSIWRTTDGGASWQIQTSDTLPDDGTFTSVAFADDQNGWAVGDAGSILHTKNGGVTWSQQAQAAGGLESLAFADADTGWAAGSKGILCTADGGATWEATASGYALADVTCAGPKKAWAIGGSTVLHTSDGSTWAEQSYAATTQDLRSCDFIDGSTGWAVGAAGTTLHTVDGGVAWRPQASATTRDLYCVDFVNASEGWAVGGGWDDSYQANRWIILHTINGGATWVVQESGGPGKLAGVAFVTPEVGWAVGGDWDGQQAFPLVLHTVDGGATWTPQDTGLTGQQLYSVEFINATTGWAVGGHATYEPGVILRTQDGGATWAQWSSGEPLYSVDFVDANHGWAAGGEAEEPLLLRTSDGGASWTQLSASADGFSGVDFVDLKNGWAVGGPWKTTNALLHTSDGGDTWQAQDPGTNVDLVCACTVSASKCWVVGSAGTILATASGGTADTTPPLTDQSGADALWHNATCGITFIADDPGAPYSYGVAYTETRVDSGPWAEGSSLAIEASGDHTNDGIHTILYRSRDNGGNLEPTKSCSLRIDTRQPLTAAPSAATVRRGAWATLRYRVDDQQPCAGKATVTIKITTLGGRVVKVLKLGQRPIDRLLRCQFRCTLAKRTYRFRVFATDAAGNVQAVVGSNRLVVR